MMSLEECVALAEQIAHDLTARAGEVDRDAMWPELSIRQLQESGLAGLVVPRSAGGQGHGLYAVARVCEALGEACASTAISFGMHLVGSAVLSARATDLQHARFLRPIAEGRHLTTLAVSEPGTGAHFYLPETQAARTPTGWRLDGTKSFVTNGGHADSYVVNASAVDGAPGEFSCFVVPESTPGMRWQAGWLGWGMRGNSARSVVLDGVEVGPDALLGREGDEIWYVFRVIAPYFIVAMASTYVGVANHALALARVHLLGRAHAHSGERLADQPILQHRFGEMWASVERTRTLVHAAAQKGDADAPDALPALCSAKAEVAEVAERVAADVMTLMGGRGYAADSEIHRVYRDARAAHVMSPTTDLLRTWTGRAVLGLPLLGE